MKISNGNLPLGMTKVPEGWPLLEQAYIAFAMWAIGRDDFRESFRADTGIRFNPPKSPIDLMVDEATGATRAQFAKFLDWLTVNHWGEEDA